MSAVNTLEPITTEDGFDAFDAATNAQVQSIPTAAKGSVISGARESTSSTSKLAS